jgi:hypothetical protein
MVHRNRKNSFLDYKYKNIKLRKHTNNKGIRSIKNGSTEKELIDIAKKLGIKYGNK